MADIERCEVCRFSCKDNNKECKKFYPKQCFLGKKVHFKEDPTRHYGKHDKTSQMCVVCKNYTHYSNIAWRRLPSGYYPFCVEDARRASFIAQNVQHTEVA